MEMSPNSETKPPLRRRLIQSTLFPHNPQDNVVTVDQDLEPDVDQEDDEEGYRGSQSQSQSQGKTNRKRKPKAGASRKLAVNGNEIGGKDTDEDDSHVTVKHDFFVKVSERRHQKRQQKEQLSIHSPEKNEQICSPLDIVTNSRSPPKPRGRASSTPKKRRANVTPEKRKMNSTPSRDAINSTLYEDKILASPPKPIPDLRLEAKMTAEENSRIFAGKQIHPFFSSWKTAKKNMESIGIENKWCHMERQRRDSNNDLSPVHIFEKTQGETFSLDWGNWTFCESNFMGTSRDQEDACLQLIHEGSVNCLQFDDFLGVPPLGIPLCQNKGSSSQYPIQLEGISSYCSMPQEKSQAISSTFLMDKQEAHCNQSEDIEVVSMHQVHEFGNMGGFLENTEFVVKSDIQWSDSLHSERRASNYSDCSYQPDNSLWTTKYEPERAIEICGNCESVKFLNEWLRQWHERGSRTNKCSTDDGNWIVQDVDLNYSQSDCDSEHSDQETSLKNVLLVTGPVGSGKSAAIYACAKEQGFQVIEVNTSDWRNGALVKQKFGEAVESHWLQCSTPNLENPDNRNQLKSSPTTCNGKAVQRSANEVIELIPLSDEEESKSVGGTAVNSIIKENKISCSQSETKTLILFEDVDATLYEDRGFIATIQQLAETAKRPMILTSNSDDPDLPNNLDRIEVNFRLPSSGELLSLAYMVCAAENAKIEPCLVERFIDHCQGDIRKTIMLLQFWCQGQNQRKDGEGRNTYAPLLFDTNAGHHVLPQMIPCGYTSKLSEIIEKEITKSTLMAEKDASLMDIIEEEEENYSESWMNVKETHSTKAKKDEMLCRHCSDQDGNDFSAQFMTTIELPSCSNSPVAFTRRTFRRKYDAVMSSDSEEGLNEGLPEQTEDINAEVLVKTKRLRRKYEAVLPSNSEEECFDEGLSNKSVEMFAEANKLPCHCAAEGKSFHVESEQPLSEGEKLENDCHPSERPYFPNINGTCRCGDVSCEANKPASRCAADWKSFHVESDQLLSEGEKLVNNGHPSERPYFPIINYMYRCGDVSCEANKSASHCLADGKSFHVESEQLLYEGEKLENNCHPSERPYSSNINGMCKSGDVSCVPESSYVPETEIENGTMMYSAMYSCGHVDNGIEEAPTSVDFVPRTMQVEFNNLDGYVYEEDKGPVVLVRDLGSDTAPVQGEEIGDSHIEPTEGLPREYQMMDECSRVDFGRKAESMHGPKPVASTDVVQETWRKLRKCKSELRQYVSVEEKDTLQALTLSSGMTNLISEADLLFADCQSLTYDYLKPSMVPIDKPHSFSWHDDQLQMASTIAQHGFCLYAKRSVAAGSSAKGVDLAWEMLAASTNAISLGKLINRSQRMAQSLRPRMRQDGVSLKSMLELPLCRTVQSVVPLRSQLSLKGYVFHEYLSSLAQISRSESSRLSEAINKSNQRRKRVARNYLSNGALALSAEDISLLDQYSCYQSHSSRPKIEG